MSLRCQIRNRHLDMPSLGSQHPSPDETHPLRLWSANCWPTSQTHHVTWSVLTFFCFGHGAFAAKNGIKWRMLPADISGEWQKLPLCMYHIQKQLAAANSCTFTFEESIGRLPLVIEDAMCRPRSTTFRCWSHVLSLSMINVVISPCQRDMHKLDIVSCDMTLLAQTEVTRLRHDEAHAIIQLNRSSWAQGVLNEIVMPEDSGRHVLN